MNMPSEIITAVKDNNTSDLKKTSETTVIANTNSLSVFDKISASYNKINSKIDRYTHEIKVLRKNADKIKEEIHRKKNIDETVEPENNTDDKQKLKKKIEVNNYSINEETCNTAIDQINDIRSNISANSKVAHDTLLPLEESFDLLKTQVKYTILLEGILELFNKKKKLEKKLSESDQIIAMLAESLGTKLEH
jgi:outer membrane murein-binding lipoprotein Lpp